MAVNAGVAMDAADLTKLFMFAVLGVGLGRFVLTSLDRAESGFASLWVPPDRTLGWPRGVQESDEPWAWRRAKSDDSLEPAPVGVSEPGFSTVDPAAREGSLIVPVAPVAPVHLALHSSDPALHSSDAERD
jgi:hypothetical protein